MQRLTFWLILSLVTVIPLVSVIAWWLQVPLAKALAIAAAQMTLTFIFLSLALRSVYEPLQRLATTLRRGEKPSDLLLQELNELGEAVTEAWQRWQEAFSKLSEERALLRAILHQMQEAVLVTGEHGTVLLANPEAEKLLSLRPNYKGRRLTELDLPFELLELVQRANRQGSPQTIEIQVLHPTERFWDAYASPLAAGNKRLGTLLVIRDLTELKRLERVQRDFVANVSHELRTPIASLRSLAEAMLMGGKDDPEVMERFLNAISNEAERVGKLLEDLLELARIDSGRRERRFEPVNLDDILAQVLERFEKLAERKGLTVKKQVTDDLVTLTDPNALAQILSNLIDNAIKYTMQGEISVSVEQVEAVDGDWVAIHIRDTGIGIPPEHLPRIFERFYRVDKARSRQQGGFGLGLSIAKKLTELIGGKITVQSEVGKGSTFTVWLPLSKPA